MGRLQASIIGGVNRIRCSTITYPTDHLVEIDYLMDKLRLILQFLALDNDQKQSLLPAKMPGGIWEIFETNIRTDSPLFCIGYECWSGVDRLYEQLGPEEQELVSEMRVILNLMIEIRESYPTIWTVCNTNRYVEGEADRLWSILERLAKILLARLAWPPVAPTIDLQTFITSGRITK